MIENNWMRYDLLVTELTYLQKCYYIIVR